MHKHGGEKRVTLFTGISVWSTETSGCFETCPQAREQGVLTCQYSITSSVTDLASVSMTEKKGWCENE